jgi:DNA repair exonuclease SbcCD ATPase subunit
MFLNKLLLKDFGKFHNKEIELKPGLNLICGPNEAGKTTIKDFIVGMFYGIDKSRGLGARFDNYELRKPLEHSGYSGKAYLKDGEDTYLIERSFLRNNRSVSTMNIRTGQDLRLGSRNSMQGVLFDMDKSTYANTLCIGEDGAKPGMELADGLENYLANLSTTGAVDIDKSGAIERLKSKKKEFNTKPYEAKIEEIDTKLHVLEPLDEKLEEVRESIKEVDQEFAMETAKRKREARKLIETKQGVEYEDDDELEEGFEALQRNSTFLDADLHESAKPPKPLTDRLWFILLTGLFVIGVIAALVYILPFEHSVRQLFIVCTILFVAVTIVEGLYAKGAFEGEIATPSEDDFKQVIYEMERKTEAYQDVEIDMSFASEYAEKKSELRTMENAIVEKLQAREVLREERLACSKKLKKMQDELDAIDLAIKTINDVSTEIHGDLGFLINDKISDIVSKITDGKYQDVRLDEKLKVKVWDGSSFISIDYLSAGTVEQIYLAVRLSVARVLCKDRMPLIIDDIFTNYDEQRLVNTLDCLKTIDTEQIILLTSNNRIGDMLDELDMDYNYVELD